MASIFISYRRTDTPDTAYRLHRDLQQAFNNDVFLDIDSIHGGDKWKTQLKEKVQNARVVIAFIGKDWLLAKDKTGKRLHQRKDWVRQEIETALNNPNTKLIPVYFGIDTQCPIINARDLPKSIQGLCDNQAIRIKPADEYQQGLKKLVREIKHALAQGPTTLAAHPLKAQVVQLCNQSHEIGLGYVINNTIITPAHKDLQKKSSRTKISLNFHDGHSATIESIICGHSACLIKFKPLMRDIQSILLAVGRPQQSIECDSPLFKSKHSWFNWWPLQTDSNPSQNSAEIDKITLQYNVKTRDFSHEHKTILCGPLFYQSYLTGLMDSEGCISTPNDWHHERSINDILPIPVQPRGWAYDPYIRAHKPSTNLRAYIYGPLDNPGVRISNDAGNILDDRNSMFDGELFSNRYTPEKLAQLFIEGQTAQLTESASSTARSHALELGLWLSKGLFGDVTYRKKLLQKAGWQAGEDLADRPVALTLSFENHELEALPWRTLACKQSAGHGYKSCFLGQNCSWVINIESDDQQTTNITIRRPAKVLLIALHHSDKGVQNHLKRIERIIKHSERNARSHSITIVQTVDELQEALNKHRYDLIYAFGSNVTNKGTTLQLHSTDKIQRFAITQFKEALQKRPASIVVLNTFGQQTEGWFEIAQQLKPYAGYLIVNPEPSKFEACSDYGLQLIRGLSRNAEAPEYLSWYSDLNTWPESRCYNPIVYKQPGSFDPQYKAIESLRSIKEILHQLDRENARTEVINAIKEALTQDNHETNGLSFIYVGLPGNEVRGFAEGLSQSVDMTIADITMVVLHVASLPEERPLAPKEMRLHIKERLKTALLQQKHLYEGHAKTSKSKLVFWVNWGFHIKEDPIAWTDKELVQWHKALKDVLNHNDINTPKKVLFVTTYGKELSSKEEHSNYAKKLRKDFKKANIRYGSLEVHALIELENIEHKHIEGFIKKAPYIFGITDKKTIDDIADIIEDLSKGQYEFAQKLLLELYIEGHDEFLDKYDFSA